MATTFISTNSISTTLRISAMKSQVALSRATQEATNGRLSDVGLSLGALTGRDVVLRAELVDVDKLVDTNALVSGHLDVAQQRVGGLIDTAEAFQKDLLAARNSANGGNIIGQPAGANLDSLIATLNVTMDGQYLFGGINTAVAPLADYAAGSANKTAVDAAFLSTFGFAQNSPAASGISVASMQSFLDTTFKSQFDDPAYRSGEIWSHYLYNIVLWAPGKPPDMESPFTVPTGSTLLELAGHVHREFTEKLKSARIWGTGVFDGQTVTRDHVLHDKDIVELHV